MSANKGFHDVEIEGKSWKTQFKVIPYVKVKLSRENMALSMTCVPHILIQSCWLLMEFNIRGENK